MGKKFSGVMLACLFSLAVLAPSALADARFSVMFMNDATGSATSSSAGVYDNNSDPSNHTGETVQLIRAGSVIATGTGDGYRQPFVETGPLAAGDELRYTGNGADRTFTYDGLPSVDLAAACIGSSAFTGAVNAAVKGTDDTPGNYVHASVFPPEPGESGYPESITDTSTAAGDGTFKVTTKRAIADGDGIYVESGWVSDDTRIHQDMYRKVAACVVPPAPPTPTPEPPATPTPTPTPPPVQLVVPPTIAEVLAALQTGLGTQAFGLSKMDLADVVGQGSVTVPFTFLMPGTVEFSWDVAGASIAKKKAKKAKAVRIATGAKTLKQPGKANVKLRLTKAGKKLLRKAKSVRLVFNAKFTPATGGAAQTTSTKLTLKKKATKKSKKRG